MVKREVFILRGGEILRFLLRESSRGCTILTHTILTIWGGLRPEQPRGFDAVKNVKFHRPAVYFFVRFFPDLYKEC